MKPILIINFKTYAESGGKNAFRLAKLLEREKNHGIDILVAPQHADLEEVAKKTKLKVLAQHIDSVDVGAHTGSVTAKSVKEIGAVGTFLNHSEKKLSMNEIGSCIRLARKYRLLSFCFAANEKETRKIIKLNPDFLIYEPPELVGTGISVSKARPNVLRNVVQLVKKEKSDIPVLCGAGITNGKDVRAAMELGTNGVALASGLIKSKSKKKVLKNLIDGFF